MSDSPLPIQKQIGHPRLHIAPGTQFGYRAELGFKRKPLLLVETPEEVSLNAGLHLLVAPNGAGKTTLLRTLAGLHPALRGQPEITGCIHYVSDQLQMDGELLPRTLFRAWFKGAALSYSMQLAETLSLNVRCQIQRLSRGNRQKVLLIVAETLAAYSGPSLMLLDEPLTGMDAEAREIVAGLWADPTPSILRLVVLHELEAVKQADSLFTVVRGKLRHTCERKGQSWMETCQLLRAQ